MENVVLKATAADGQPLEATFNPEKGMTLIGFKKGAIEVIDQANSQGRIIGPHFQNRNPQILPHLSGEQHKDPYPNGIGRYAPWQVKQEGTKLEAKLSGKDNWNETPLSKLEGQNFAMTFNAELTSEGLKIYMAVVSDKDSLVGIDYTYHLPESKGRVLSQVSDHYFKGRHLQKIPPEESFFERHRINLNLTESFELAFHPHPNPCEGKITLETPNYKLHTTYLCESQENCWLLNYQKDKPYVRISPVSSQDPFRPNLTVSSLSICLEIA